MKSTRCVMAALFLILAVPAASSQTYSEVWITSSYDGAITRSVIMEPKGYSGAPCPLLITLHGMGGDAWKGIRGFDQVANARGWLAASPDTHGENDPTGEISLGARAMQHDVLDLIDHVAAGWNVDADRVYLTGRSMGGMGTSLVAAKYPHRFAAAVEWFGPTNLTDSYHELWWGNFRTSMETEIGGPPSQYPEEYSRRSPIEYARNLRHLPFAIAHGQFDYIVLPHHAEDFAAEIDLYLPTKFYGIYWNMGAHFIWPQEFDLTLRFLEKHTRNVDPPDIVLRTDEDQDFYWAAVAAADPGEWRTVEAIPLPATNELHLSTRNAAAVCVDASRAGLDTGSSLAVTFGQSSDSVFSLCGLDPAHTYTVQRNGSPWPWCVWDPATATLDVTVSLAQSGPDPFVIE